MRNLPFLQRIVSGIAVLLLCEPAALAASIQEKMYDENDFFQQFLMSGDTRYIAFQALTDLRIVSVTNSGSPLDPSTNATFTYQLFQTDENWNTPNGNGDRIWLHQGSVHSLGSPVPIGVELQAGGYYRISLNTSQWNQDIYTRLYDTSTDPLRVTPFNTLNNLFRVIGPGVIADGNDFIGITFTVETTLSVVIDIKPGSEQNKIDPSSTGTIWVVVLSSTETPFDPLQIDISTVRFGPNGAIAIRNKVSDLNQDGLADLWLRFKILETGIQCGDTEATLIGQTYDGLAFTGTDSIKTVRCQ